MVIFITLVNDKCSEQPFKDAHTDLDLHYQQMPDGILQQIGAQMFF